ncbi:MAG: tetratricopeptide repeat protein [Bradymonadales bacterium]|jgi:tetratricopeptide (TPR) repeat protein
MRQSFVLCVCIVLASTFLSCAKTSATSESQVATTDTVVDIEAQLSTETAQDLILAQRYEEATQMLHQILESQPNNLLALELRAVSQIKSGVVTRSLDDFIAITQIQPSARAFFNLGVALHQLGFCERAVDAYRRALELSPNDYQLMTNMGAAYVCYGKRDEGIAVLNQALISNPNNELVLTNLGIAYLEKKDVDNALIYLNRAVQANEAYASAHFALFRLHFAQNNHEQGKKHLRRFAELMPNSRKVRSYEKEMR